MIKEKIESVIKLLKQIEDAHNLDSNSLSKLEVHAMVLRWDLEEILESIK